MVVEVLEEKEKREKRKRKEKASEASRHKRYRESEGKEGTIITGVPPQGDDASETSYLLLCLSEEFVWREAPQPSGGGKKCSCQISSARSYVSEVVSRRCHLTEPEPHCRDPRLVVARGRCD